MRWRTLACFVSALLFLAFVGTRAEAEAPLVVFDMPFALECREVTPKGYRESYQKRVIEAVFKISPQLLAGEERDLRRLRYEISTEQQMPIVGYLPDSQVASDIEGNIAIKTREHHGQLLVHYFFTPAAGDGKLQADLESSQAQYSLLAPKQLLLATGTIQRGCGVFYDLKPSTQDTLQKPREYACLFEVPASWRADYAMVTCRARGMKRTLMVANEVNCGSGTLAVGLYCQHDGEARAIAEELARRQQIYLNRLAQESRASQAKREKAEWLAGVLENVERAATQRTTMKAKQPNLGVGAAIQEKIQEDKALGADFSLDTKSAGDELAEAKESLRRLNGKK